MRLRNKITSLWLRTAAIIILFLSISQNARPFPTSTYAEKSVLAEGRWVKISVKESGMYLIKAEDLRKWGFTDVSRVRVYGYGGKRIPDALTPANYTDDLPLVQTVNTSAGVYFYGVGVVEWKTLNGTDFRPSSNPFSVAGYYYITDSDEPLREITTTGNPTANNPATTFRERLFHERDLISLAETGHMLVGEDFRLNRTQKFNFKLTDKAADTQVWLEADMVVKSIGFTTTLLFNVNDTELPSTSADIISSTQNTSHHHGTEAMIRKTFDLNSDNLQLQLTLKTSTTPSNANLNYIAVNYTRQLKMNGNSLTFTGSKASLKLANTTAKTVIWDVTDPLKITKINASTAEANTMTWTSSYGNSRQYAAWNEDSSLPSPEFVASVANQNIHGMETPDMVIFTIPDYATQAERLAQFHRESEDTLKVLVLNQDIVFNEFSSGTADVNSLRRCLKMFYDRGIGKQRQLRYALFFGKASHDNRHLTDAVKAQGVPTMPTWESEEGLNDNTSYTTDDIFGFLLDNSGVSTASDKLQVALGRISVTSNNEAKTVVDKIIKYATSSPEGNWQNNVLIVCDDEDNGVHLKQSENMWKNMLNTDGGKDMFYQKVYIDAYDRTGGTYPGARSDMFRILEEGTAFWAYSGHANPNSWTADGLMTYTDIASLYLKRLPVVFAFTCDFQRWDGKDASAAEILFKNANGGVAAAFSATRPVYISDNGYFSSNVGRYIFSKDGEGKRLTIGEAVRLAKNNYLQEGRPVSNANKLRYVLLGDPAIRLVTPSPKVKVTEINGVDINSPEPPIIKASQQATVTGVILNNDGSIMNDYNGVVTSTLYDAETSVTTKGNGETGSQDTFDQQGTRLYAGSDSIIGGHFNIKMAMPSEIADNYRNAAINLYASSSKDTRRGVGVNRDFYVYGFDDSAPEDNEPPMIEAFYLNHSSFQDGDKVNESPMAIAQVSDNVAINLSMAGIGHQMTMWLDGAEKSYNDVSQFYTPASDGSPSGTIAYQLENLTEGEHSLRLRVWDTAANPAEQTIYFQVENGLPAKAFDVYADSNPASAETNFYISHNRPDAMVEVTIEIYDIMGRLVWTSVQSGRSDLFTTFPITWNLTDMAGRRVQQGIYVYRASLKSEDGTSSNSLGRKIAVAGNY